MKIGMGLAGTVLARVWESFPMKKILLFFLLAIGLSVLGTGCLPPPHGAPKPPTPPGGPAAAVVHQNFGNLLI